MNGFMTFVAIRNKLQAESERRGISVGDAFALWGDDPMDVVFLINKGAQRTSGDGARLENLLQSLKARGLDLTSIVGATA